MILARLTKHHFNNLTMKFENHLGTKARIG